MAAVRVCVWSDAANDWDCTGYAVPWPHWSAQPSEAQVGAMQAEGRQVPWVGGFAAYAEWLALINPPGPERDPRD